MSSDPREKRERVDTLNPQFNSLNPFFFVDIMFFDTVYLPWTAVAVSLIYLLTVRRYRYERSRTIESSFKDCGRPLSSMTVKEAHNIVRGMRQLEFPFAMHLAMKISLLKVGFFFSFFLYYFSPRPSSLFV